jgi:hypothetical protein
MRGDDQRSGHLFSYLSPEQRVPTDHPLRAIRQMTDEALRQLSPQLEAIYATSGPRPLAPACRNALLTASRAMRPHLVAHQRVERSCCAQLEVLPS